MADKRITELTTLAPVDNADWVAVVDVSDTTDGPAGTTKKAARSEFKGDTGATGAKGDTGATGPAGADGANGTNGTNGSNGSDGADGADGASAFVYIAYASDGSGTGFTTTFNAALDYIAVLSTDTEIPSPAAGDFAGLWKNYKGATGEQGPQGEQGDPGADGTGTGDVVGPASSTDNSIARFDGTTGKLVQNSAVTIDDSGNVGIGNTSPAYPLSVNGDVGLSLNSRIIGPVIGGNQAILKFDDAGTGARLNFSGDYVDFSATSLTRFNTAGIEINNGGYLQGGKNFTNFASGATSGSTLKNSGKWALNARYWDASQTRSEDAVFSEQYVLSGASPVGRVAYAFSDTNSFSNIEAMSLTNTGNLGIGVTSPTAALHLKAGTASANTAPQKFTSGTLMTTPEAGTVEFDGSFYYLTI